MSFDLASFIWGIIAALALRAAIIKISESVKSRNWQKQFDKNWIDKKKIS